MRDGGLRHMEVRRRSRTSRRPEPLVEGRRGFLKLALCAGAAFASPVLRMLGGVLPVRYVEAVRPRPTARAAKRLDEAEIARPAKWAG